MKKCLSNQLKYEILPSNFILLKFEGFFAVQQVSLAAELAEDSGRTVGQDIRALRKARSMTLAELALALGRSSGWLSQVERGQSDPAIRDLRKVAEVFSLPISFFFSNDDAPAEERGYIVRADARRTIGSGDDLREELLSPDMGGSFELIRSVFAPGAELREAASRETEDAGYVIAGELDLEINGTTFRLHPGDSFRFAGEPYRWSNPGDVDAVVVWVISPPVY